MMAFVLDTQPHHLIYGHIGSNVIDFNVLC
jgi:hypothetical protein